MNLEEHIKDNKLKIVVKANSNKNEILGFESVKNGVRVTIKEPADKNKANKEIVKFFSKLLKKQVRIKSGLTSKEKILEIL